MDQDRHLLDGSEADRTTEHLRAQPMPPHLWIYATWEPDDGLNSPFPRGLAITRTSSLGTCEPRHELRGAR
ncbi:hypothetical protein ACIQ9Q_41560 [Streptomyces sp. NPDC094438]|uniref:hypothetical protein n=1 Tax=Streptomyces sp. NPDC094438 TaxID=3366061 RepID=UPI0037F6AC64